MAIVTVGLPARGKTYMARKLRRYLTWRGYRARVFNVGNYRRERVGARQPHTFFDPDNPDGRAARTASAHAAMADLLTWFREGGEVGVYDATNSTRARRRWVVDQLAAAGVGALFVESICSDAEVIEANIRQTKLLSPDYAGMDPEAVVADFRARIAHYERTYEPIDEPDLSWLKVIDVGRQITANHIRGYLPARLVFFLMNLHVTPRTIWLTRHGQSAFNLLGRIGGDADLAPAGSAYADVLAGWVRDRVGPDGPLEVWTSTLQRSVQTAAPLGRPAVAWRELDEIDSGVCDGMTYAEVEAAHPDEFAARQADKLRYRYPRGESYEDVMARVEPVLIELERQRDPVLVICHQAVLRALYGYFLDERREDCPYLEVPLHTVIELTPRAYGCDVRHFPIGPQVANAGSS